MPTNRYFHLYRNSIYYTIEKLKKGSAYRFHDVYTHKKERRKNLLLSCRGNKKKRQGSTKGSYVSRHSRDIIREIETS